MLTLPTTRQEGWRWSDLSSLSALAEARPSGRVPDALPWLDLPGERLLFVDGRLAEGHAKFGDLPHASDHPLGRLAGAHGLRLHVRGRGEEVLQIVHVTTGGADHLPIEIVVDAGAGGRLVETFVGAGWANRASRIRLGAAARLDVARRLLGTDGFTSIADDAELADGARLTLVTLAMGSGDSRIDPTVKLTGDSAHAEVGGALLARGNQRHDANALVRHALPHGASRQLWRLVADERATTSVAARVEVARDAQKTDGEQSLRALLLARTATANLKPELEIFADDVKCAHGATVGELDRNALFYLAARGIPPVEARALLTRAFVADALAAIDDEAVREAFAADADRWLGAPA